MSQVQVLTQIQGLFSIYSYCNMSLVEGLSQIQGTIYGKNYLIFILHCESSLGSESGSGYYIWQKMSELSPGSVSDPGCS